MKNVLIINTINWTMYGQLKNVSPVSHKCYQFLFNPFTRNYQYSFPMSCLKHLSDLFYYFRIYSVKKNVINGTYSENLMNSYIIVLIVESSCRGAWCTLYMAIDGGFYIFNQQKYRIKPASSWGFWIINLPFTNQLTRCSRGNIWSVCHGGFSLGFSLPEFSGAIRVIRVKFSGHISLISHLLTTTQ